MRVHMKHNDSKQIDDRRVAQLIECYGAALDSWPQEYRQAAKELIQGSDELRQLLQEAQQLDDALLITADYSLTRVSADPADVASVIDKLPEQQLPQPARPKEKNKAIGFGSWFDGLWIKGGMVAAGLAILVTSTVLLQPQSPTSPVHVAVLTQQELDQWMWEDITGTGQEESEENLTFMALVDLEVL